MHQIQSKILALIPKHNLASLTLREIGGLIGEDHPQIIKHHYKQLFKKGYIKESNDKTSVLRIDQYNSHIDKFISIPILGAANCGEPLIFADENLQGYLQVSKSIVPYYDHNNVFALKAKGNSMNRAQINGLNIEENDFLIIDKRTPSNLDNKYVLSVINGMANIKKFVLDKNNNRILLLSESSKSYAPIVIHEQDYDEYIVNGEVKQVIKAA